MGNTCCCDRNADCFASSGGPVCVCADGYVGDGMTCSPDSSMCTPSSQPSAVIGSCAQSWEYGYLGCEEFTGSAFMNPLTGTRLCKSTYAVGRDCDRSSTVGRCLIHCGGPEEQVIYISAAGMTTDMAQKECAQLHGTWLGK
jgi:hypothetical protein